MKGDGPSTRTLRKLSIGFIGLQIRGYPLSQVNIGLMYQSGEGVSQDYAEAMAWFKKAADQGYLPAYLRIGLAYRDGRGVDRNYAEAAEWFKKAADQGYADAELELGWFYENGLGEDKNNDRAKVWYQKAADQGNSGAQAALQRLVASNAPTASTAETTPPAPNAEAQSDEWLGWGDFNNKFKLRVSLGYYPETSAARCESGVVDIRAHWVARPPGMGWYFFVLPEDKFNAKNSDLTGQGFALRYDDTFECAGRTLHQTLWTKSAPVESNSPSVNVATFPAPPLALTAQAPATTPAEENEQGDRYFYGRGVEQDYAKAMEWYRKAADRGLQTHNTMLERSTKTAGVLRRISTKRKSGIRRPPITVTPSRRPPCSGCSPSKIHQGKPHLPPSLP